MKKFSGLKFIPQNNTNSRSRVFFCCAKEDFDKYFEPISKELLAIQPNVTIWYRDPKEEIPTADNIKLLLSQMQLFVIPITSNFLCDDCDELKLEFQFAIENHIPLLPLMQEPGLVEKFTEMCGDIQFLDKNENAQDETAIPYKKKLADFLNVVLLSDEMIHKIREAFDAYIFLSYRKKDRKYAQNIMKLIHENEFCNSVAIWYDEFLVPGENFNSAIEEAMKKSNLFTLVVTPNLLENGNYVERIEYPMAVEIGKHILPVEAVETDREEIKKRYLGMPELVSAHETDKLAIRLQNALSEALKEQDSSKEHLFFIGLAYLSGVDVEVDHEKARKLIEKAAELGLHEAYRNLVEMYKKGIGVVCNQQTAYEWQLKLINLLEKEYSENDSENNFGELLTEIVNLRVLIPNSFRKFINVKSVLKNELQYINERLTRTDSLYAKKMLVVNFKSYLTLEETNSDKKAFLQNVLKINEEIVSAEKAIRYRRYLPKLYCEISSYSESDEAKEWLQKAINTQNLLVEEFTSSEDYDVSEKYEAYYRLCEYKKKWAARCYPEAKENFMEARTFFKDIINTYKTCALSLGTPDAYKQWFMETISNESVFIYATNENDCANRLLEAESILMEIQKKFDSFEGKALLIDCYLKIYNLCRKLDNQAKSEEYLEKASELLEKLAPDYRHGTILDHSFHSVIRNLFKADKKALAIRMVNIFRNILDERRIKSNRKNIRRVMSGYEELASSISNEYDELKNELYHIIIDEYSKNIAITKDVSLYDELMNVYMDLANLCHNAYNDIDKEVAIYKNCINKLEDLTKDFDFAFIYKHLEKIYNKLGRRLSLNGAKAEGLCYMLKAYDVCEKKCIYKTEYDLEMYRKQIIRISKKIDNMDIEEEYLSILNRILESTVNNNTHH